MSKARDVLEGYALRLCVNCDSNAAPEDTETQDREQTDIALRKLKAMVLENMFDKEEAVNDSWMRGYNYAVKTIANELFGVK